MKRRTFLQGASALFALGSARPAAALPPRQLRRGFVIIKDVTPEVSSTKLDIVLKAATNRGLPVSVIVETQSTEHGTLRPQSELSTTLADFVTHRRGLVEMVPFAPALGYSSVHFRARAAFQAREELTAALQLDTSNPATFGLIRSIACPSVIAPVSPEGVRSAGIRSVLMLPEKQEASATELWPDGTLRLLGGRPFSLEEVGANEQPESAEGPQDIILLSASEWADTDPEVLRNRAESFAGALLETPSISAWHLLSEAPLRDSLGYSRSMSIHFLAPPQRDQGLERSIEATRADLASKDIPSSTGSAPWPDIGAPPSGGYWIDIQGAPSEESTLRAFTYSVDPASGIVKRFSEHSRPEGQGVVLVTQDRGLHAGIDDHGHLNLPTYFAGDLESLGNLKSFSEKIVDFCLVVSSELLRQPVGRISLRHAVQAILDDGATKTMALPSQVSSMLPRNPALEHFRRAEAYAQAGSVDPTGLSDSDESELLEDARTAWQYFANWTNTQTGLCPATVNFGGATVELHQAVTMWDVGSHINALIAAADIGLITRSGFQRSIRKLKPNIAGRRYAGRLLPQGWIRTDRIKWGTRDFDASDAGRLMSALHRLNAYPWTDISVKQIVDSWDLERVIQAGKVQSVVDGIFRTNYRSHCAHYTALAFQKWGFDARSPYDVLSENSEMDGKVSLIESAGWIGPLGAEPLLLEAIELGMSPESAYLSDILFSAQLKHFEKTGEHICVSEGPIDRAPWFTYQGLQLDAYGTTWATDTVDGLAKHRSTEFVEKNLVVSSKAAFLWLAYRPHDYSRELVRLVRDRARTRHGFAASIYRSDGRATAAYTDLNTNAVILQSVAEILKKSKNQKREI